MKVRVFAIILCAAAGLSACHPQAANPRTDNAASAAAPRPAVAPVPTPSGDVEFRAVLDLDQTPWPNEPDLRGGHEAASSEWPASLYATFAANGATAACTAALVGPSVMLTAAHCVPAAGGVTFSYGRHPPYHAACTRHPDYDPPVMDASADYALCVITPAFAAPAGFQYETVSTSSMSSLPGRTIVLASFGCVSSVAAGAPFDGRFRIGFSTVDQSSASTTRTYGDEYYSPKETNNLFTSVDRTRTNFCPGDSGGPVFAPTSDGPALTARAIVGVTSRAFRDAEGTGFGTSIISATGGPVFHAWAVQWARQAGAAACGIAGQVANCRS